MADRYDFVGASQFFSDFTKNFAGPQRVQKVGRRRLHRFQQCHVGSEKPKILLPSL